MEQPDGIILTVSRKMYEKNGYRHWLKNFFHAMRQEDWIYSLRVGNRPKKEVLYVYLLIGGKIRFRANFVGSMGPTNKTFSDGRSMFAKAWVELAGPVKHPAIPIPMKGFQGFRYTEKLF